MIKLFNSITILFLCLLQVLLHLSTLNLPCNKSVVIRLNVCGKTRNIAIQLVLQHCCKTSYTFLLSVLPNGVLVFTAPFIWSGVDLKWILKFLVCNNNPSSLKRLNSILFIVKITLHFLLMRRCPILHEDNVRFLNVVNGLNRGVTSPIIRVSGD